MKHTNENIKYGLTDKQVIESRKKYGANQITTVNQAGFFKLLVESLGDPIIKILLIALAIKVVFLLKSFDWYETIGIVIAIFVASFISTISEYGSEQAFSRLQEESAKIKCRVKRNRKIIEISVDEVVCNDIVMLEAGDKIPADGVIIKGEISVDESALNGETKEQYKYPVTDFNTTPSEKNQIYRGTVVYSKTAEMLVTEVGDKTFYGKLATELQEKQPDSPLKLRLLGLAKFISRIGYVGSLLVTISYLFSVIVIDNGFVLDKIITTLSNLPLMFGYILYALTLSVTIIVVAVPEGLPMMITLVLSSNMKRMLKNNVLVRKMVGIETAGSINILFTDKTGTLTKGKLEMISYVNGSLKEYKQENEIHKNPKLYEIVKTSLIGNNNSTYDSTSKKIIGGNITERALLNFFKNKDNYYTKTNNIPFDSKNKYSISTIGGTNYIKGAPEKIISFCSYYYNDLGNKTILTGKNKINEYISNLTASGMRVIAIATSENRDLENFNNLTLVGIAVIKDEIRKEAKEGVKLVTDAHIQMVMITGDNKDTAVSIAKEVGILTNPNDIVLTSLELNQKSDDEIKKIMPNLKIVARALPQDKSRLVKISQEMNLVVGMTGDGVNDAPALKKADVGFAMGSGTEVSKEASDIVILDDNILSISKAILFGRTIFKSIRKFIILQLTANLCALSLSIVGPFIGINTPITVMQMLWINMVMDTLAGLAFAYEPPLLEYMKEKPKRKDEQIINKYMLNEILITGLYSALICIVFLKVPFIKNFFRSDLKYFMSAFFGLLIFIDVFNCFNARTHRLNLLAHIHRNKTFILIMILIFITQIFMIYYGGVIFRTAGLTFKEFQIMLLIAATVIPFDWFRKMCLRLKGIKGGV